MNPDKERTGVISNLRACLLSTKGGIPVKNLNSDYRQLIGENVPFQRLGYKTLEDFLRTVSDVSLRAKGGETFIEAKASESSSHITSLVEGQKRTASKKKPKFSASQAYVHIKPKKHPRYRRRSATPAYPQWPQTKPHVPLSITSDGVNRVTFVKSSTVSFEDENRNIKKTSNITTKKSPHSTLQRLNSDSKTDYRSLDGNSAISSNSISSSVNRTQVPFKSSMSLDSSSSSKSNRLQKNQSQPAFEQHPPIPNQEVPFESKLTNRLKQAKQSAANDSNSLTKNEKHVKISSTKSAVDHKSKGSDSALISLNKSKGPPSKAPKQSAQSRLEKTRASGDSKLTVVVDHQQGEKSSYFQNQLAIYVHEHNLESEPTYVVYKVKSGKHQICFASTVRVVIPRMSFSLPQEVLECSTFPNDFLDPVEAKENAAKLLLEKLKERDDFLNAPILKDPKSIISCVEQAVAKKDNGIWAHKFEDDIMVTRKEILPDYWLDIVKVSDKFEVEQLGPSCIIRMKDELNNNQSFSTMPAITFPPGNTWDVYITFGKVVNDINLRFIGDEYSTRYDLMATDLEKYYEVKENLVQPKLIIGEYYAAYFDNSWWRVTVTKIEVDKIRIKFIDHGDEVNVPRSVLYKLAPQFFKVPPQAISISLKGLEEYSHRKDAEDFFFKTIIGRSLVAVVEELSSSNVSLTLYDTSNEEAVNLNESLKNLFDFDYTKPLSLEVGAIHEMCVSHIELDGTVYVQVVSDTLSLLQDHIDFLEEHNFESLKDTSEICLDKVYLVIKDNSYYRAKLRTTSFIDGKVEVFFIDFGNTGNVFLEDICNIEDTSYLLGNIPGQAYPVYLHDISSGALTEPLRERFLQLMSGDPPPVIVGRVRAVQGLIPVVEFFRRTEPDNLLISINQTLVLEADIHVTKKIEELNLKPKHLTRTQDLINKILNAYPNGCIERLISANRPQLPEIDQDFQIYVHDTVSPSHFLINPQDYVASLNQLMDDMNTFYNSNPLKPTLVEGIMCAAKDGSFWYRAYIDKVIDSENVSTKVLDYGCVKIISSNFVKPLLEVFMRHPYIGYTARVYGIEPIHGDWSVEDSIAMKNLINKKTLRAKLKDIVYNKQSIGGMTLSLELFGTDPKTGLEFNVAEHFVKQYHAKFE